jgi:hypothetical protein
MAWNAIFINRKASPEAVVNAVGQLFDVDPQAIIITQHDRWRDYVDDPNMVLICDLTLIPGDFPLRLRILANRVHVPHIPPFTGEAVGFLCELLGCQALAEPDEDDDDYTWLLVYDRHTMQRVSVNPERLDNEGAFEVVS